MKTNRLFTLILLVTMFFSLYTQSGVAAEDSAATFDVVSFEYCDDTDTPIPDLSTFTANQVIKAKATVKNVGTATGSITLMIMAYQDGKLIRFASAVVNDIAVSATAPASASITLPANPTGCEVYSYIWKDLTDMGALTKAAVAGSDNAEIDSLKICNVPVSFDADGNADVEFPFGFTGVLTNSDFEFDFGDISTKYLYNHNSEDKVITINTTSSGGSTKAYTVNYTVAAPNISVAYDHTNSGNFVDLTTTRVIREPDERLTLPENQAKTAGEALGGASDDYSLLADNATLAWNDRQAMYFEQVPSYLIGATYFPTSYSNASADQIRAKIKITTEHNIRVYFLGYAHPGNPGAYTPTYTGIVDDDQDFVIKNVTDDEFLTQPLSAYGSVSAFQDGRKIFYYDIELGENETSKEVTLQGGAYKFFPTVIAYQLLP